MPPLQDWFDRLRPKAEEQRIFQTWPIIPPPRPVLAGRLGALSALSIAPSVQQNPEKYSPAIVIGLGETGEQVLRRWLAQVDLDPAGPQHTLRTLLVTATPVPLLRSTHIQGRQFDLTNLSSGNQSSRPRNPREEMHQLFRQYTNFGPFKDHLSNYLADLRKEIRVVIVASVAEPIIGILGDVLQLLRLIPGPGRDPYQDISALLTLSAPRPALEPGEIFAALREIGRFTFSGWHWMDPPRGMTDTDGIVRSALLDQIFLVHTHSNQPKILDLRNTPFKDGVGQALSEALFVLLHPSASPLWQNLRNDLSQGSYVREKTHEPVINSLGIATLQIPLVAMQNYLAARLAYAAIFGEIPNTTEGLLRRGEAPTASAEHLARQWLMRGPCSHPFFEWLLNVQDVSSFRLVPQIGPVAVDALQAQLAHGLHALLNDPTQVDRMDQAVLVVQYLRERFQQWEGWFQTAPASPQDASERAVFQYVLNGSLTTLTRLEEHLTCWVKSLYAARAQQNPDQPWRASVSKPTSKADWRSALDSSASIPNAPKPAANPVPASRSLEELLQSRLQTAQASLAQVADDPICRALTADGQKGLSEVEKYYMDSVRPELLLHSNEAGHNFLQVEERLGWWVGFDHDKPMEVFLVCLGSGIGGLGETVRPPEQACFSLAQINELEGVVVNLAEIQTRRLITDLTGGKWFRQRLQSMADFLPQASRPLLSYDSEAAADHVGSITRRGYLVARDPTLTGDYRTVAFPDLAATEVNELSNGELTRVTALGLWSNIPLGAVEAYREAYRRYFHLEALHFYPQETLAARYEQRIKFFTGKLALIPSDFSLTLVHDQLITLFCQAVFYGLIDVRTGEIGGTPQWTVLPINTSKGQMGPLILAANRLGNPPEKLWEAYREFVLLLPDDPVKDQNPAHLFHRDRREPFINALLQAARQRRQLPDANNLRKNFQQKHLAYWHQRGEQDALARAFANLLEAELDEPVWKSWQLG